MQTPYLDRLLTQNTLGVSSVFSAGITTWTLPYSVAGDGSEGVLVVIDGTTGVQLASNRPALNQISVSGVNRVGAPVFIGLQYTTSYTLSAIFVRKQDGHADQRGRLQVRYVALYYEDSTDFTATVTAPGKTTRTYTYSSTSPQSGQFFIPILEHNVDVTVTIAVTNGGAFGWSGYQWEGTLFTRARLM